MGGKITEEVVAGRDDLDADPGKRELFVLYGGHGFPFNIFLESGEHVARILAGCANSVQQYGNVFVEDPGEVLDDLIWVGRVFPVPDHIKMGTVGDNRLAVSVQNIAAGGSDCLDADAIALRKFCIFIATVYLQIPEPGQEQGSGKNNYGHGDINPFFEHLELNRINLVYFGKGAWRWRHVFLRRILIAVSGSGCLFFDGGNDYPPSCCQKSWRANGKN